MLKPLVGAATSGLWLGLSATLAFTLVLEESAHARSTDKKTGVAKRLEQSKRNTDHQRYNSYTINHDGMLLIRMKNVDIRSRVIGMKLKTSTGSEEYIIFDRDRLYKGGGSDLLIVPQKYIVKNDKVCILYKWGKSCRIFYTYKGRVFKLVNNNNLYRIQELFVE